MDQNMTLDELQALEDAPPEMKLRSRSLVPIEMLRYDALSHEGILVHMLEKTARAAAPKVKEMIEGKPDDGAIEIEVTIRYRPPDEEGFSYPAQRNAASTSGPVTSGYRIKG